MWLKHRYQWETKQTNRWGIPEVQECDCGLTRRSETGFLPNPHTYRWFYSDGEISESIPLGKGW